MAEEKIYTIPLSEAIKKARVHRARYAAETVRSYLQAHTKKQDVKLGDELNKAIWKRGTQKPPRSIRVKAVVDKDTVKAELFGHDYKEFKAISVAKKEKMIDKLRARMSAKEAQTLETEKKVEGKHAETAGEKAAEAKLAETEVKPAAPKEAGSKESPKK